MSELAEAFASALYLLLLTILQPNAKVVSRFIKHPYITSKLRQSNYSSTSSQFLLPPGFLASLSFCAAWVHLLRGNTNTNLPQSKTGILRIRLEWVGNFIKPIPAIPFIGSQPETPAFEKPEKSWRGHNRCERHWRGAARHISWSPVCILWWTLHSRPRNYIDGLEIGTP